MGDESTEDDIILYRPVYACIPHERKVVTNVVKDKKDSSFAQNKKENSVSDSRELMLKPSRTNEPEVVISEDKTKVKLVLNVEPSESENTINVSTCLKGDSSVVEGEEDEVKDNGVAVTDKKKEETQNTDAV